MTIQEIIIVLLVVVDTIYYIKVKNNFRKMKNEVRELFSKIDILRGEIFHLVNGELKKIDDKINGRALSNTVETRFNKHEGRLGDIKGEINRITERVYLIENPPKKVKKVVKKKK